MIKILRLAAIVLVALFAIKLVLLANERTKANADTLSTLATTGGPAPAPYDEYWDDRFGGVPFITGFVDALAVDGDDVYVAGEFAKPVGSPGNGIAKWNGQSWSQLGNGMTIGSVVMGHVYAVAINGTDVFAGGSFDQAGDAAAARIAKWDGSSWSPLGSGVNGYVYSIAISGTDVFVGGSFTQAGGVAASRIAKWDGSSWSALDVGVNGTVYAVAVSGPDVYVCGSFTQAGGAPANRIAKWNGTTWSAMGDGLDNTGYALAVGDEGLYIGGDFTHAGGMSANYIVKWSDDSWSALGAGVNWRVRAITIQSSLVYVGGSFTEAGGSPANRVAKWDGSSWAALGGGISGGSLDVLALAVKGAEVYVGGKFWLAGWNPSRYLARWNGSAWADVGAGTNGNIWDIKAIESDIYAVGDFTRVSEVSTNAIAKWNGTSWSAPPPLVNSYYQGINCIEIDGTQMYVGGTFSEAGGLKFIAKWTGSGWAPLGSGMNNTVFDIALRGGYIYAGGGFTQAGGIPANYIAYWNGATWSALGSGLNALVFAMATSGTNLYVGGMFTQAGSVQANYIARWNGSTWSALGSGLNGRVRTIAVLGTDVYVGGEFTEAGGQPANCIAKWDGSSWSSVGGGVNRYVREITVVGDDLYVGGMFFEAGGVPISGIAKWDGVAWSPLGSGADSTVDAITQVGQELYVGGYFAEAGGKSAAKFSRYAPPASLTVLSPNGGETWWIDGTAIINWSSEGIIDTVDIDYSTDGGQTWLPIVSDTINDGSEEVAPPDVNGSYCLIRISEGVDGTPSDMSDSSFLVSMLPPMIEVTSPNGAESWAAMTSHSVTWTTISVIGDITIDLYKGGVFHSNIGTTPAEAGSYSWLIPLSLESGSDYSVRIWQDPSEDYSDSAFSIVTAPAIVVVSPNGGETFAVGGTENIRWNASTSMDNVKIEYSINGGTDWLSVVESTLNTGSYPWIVPATLSTSCLIRVADEANAADTDISDSVFSIAMAIPGVERQALIDLYNSTNGDGWTNNTGWKTPPLYTDGFAYPGTEKTWRGVYIDESSIRVTNILLSNHGLSGSVPASLGNLYGLLNLYLNSNQLSGSIPAELGNISTLQYLALSTNQLSGSIPPELGNLANLQYLHLRNNQLSGSVPPELGNLANLRLLDVSYNLLSGSIPAELGNLTSLQLLYLDRNQLSGSIPAELGNLGNLLVLSLYTNQLSDSIPVELGGLNTLVLLSLSSNQLSGTIPTELSSLTNLSSLDLAENQLEGAIPAWLGGMISLTSLKLSYNQFSGAIPPELGNLSNLFRLILHHNQLSGTVPAELSGLTNLWGLWLNANKLGGPLPDSLTSLLNLVQEFTDFGYNALYATDPDLIAFLNVKDPDWATTQTVAPTDVAALGVGANTVFVSWTPIPYADDGGGYRVYWGETSAGPYTYCGQTADKTVPSLSVSGLQPSRPYYFVVETRTDAHANNANIVDSEYSTEASAATLAQALITGTVTLGGSPLGGVVMSGLPGDPGTNGSGVYAALVDLGWSGAVMPTLAGYVFDPPARTYSGIAADQLMQGYAATLLPATITMTSPNGGETWAAGSTQDITWTQTGLSGSVTIDLYKGGVYQKTLGTAEATAGTFAWVIDAGETPGADYRVAVWQGAVSDESDGDFSIGAAAIHKDDFVGTWDGQGVYYRNSDSGAWVKMASPAEMITAGDLDGDGIDDLIGLWAGQGGIWVKYSSSGAWVKLSSTARHIAAGDMNGDGRVDLLGTWDGQGVYYRDSITGIWVKMASPADMITCGDLDGDYIDDLIGIWPAQGGVWVKYSITGAWARLSSTARDISAGDMNGDGRDDLLATWDGQGVFYRNSMTGAWVKMASEATQVTCGDLDADGTDDLIGIWPTQGGVWVKYSQTGAWARISSTAQDIAAGTMRPQGLAPAPADAMAQPAAQAVVELTIPMGGYEEGPEIARTKRDISDRGPGGARFVYIEDINLEPKEDANSALTRIPGPGEAGFIGVEQKNIFPEEAVREKRGANVKKEKIRP